MSKSTSKLTEEEAREESDTLDECFHIIPAREVEKFVLEQVGCFMCKPKKGGRK